MRLIRLFLLNFQEAFAERGRSFVWFLIALFNPLIMCAYWIGANNAATISLGWDQSAFIAYYVLLVTAQSLLIVHIDENIANADIKLGFMTARLLQPYSYFWRKLVAELPWRLLQGGFGVCVYGIFWLVIGDSMNIQLSGIQGSMAVCVIVSAFMLSFVLKMIVGITAFWTTEYQGFRELVEVISIVFSGIIMPLTLLPQAIQHIAYTLPFAYIIYYPILAIQGKLLTSDFFHVLMIQWIWIVVLSIIYRFMWKKGVLLYTAFGQ